MHDRKLIIPELLAEVNQLVVVLATVVDKKKTTHGHTVATRKQTRPTCTTPPI